MKNIILFAVQNAGKGTVAQALKEKYNYDHISTGDLLRERRKIDDEIGRIIAQTQDAGELTPPEVVYQVFEEKISHPECENYILDGFPRNVEQAIKCDEMLSKIGKDNYIVVNLTVDDEEVLRRVTDRRTCVNCSKIYSTSYEAMKPKVEGICDDCGSEVIFRKDDGDIDAIKKRIKIYHENAAGLINYYQEKGVLFTIDSTQTKNAIIEVEKIINND